MNTSVRARRDALGFSMVELLITIIIAGIAFAALVPMFVSAQQKGAGAQYRSTAINLAQDRIERLRQLPWNAVTDALTTTSLGGGLTWGGVTVGGKTYTVDLLPVQTVGTQKTVRVSVTWYEQPGHIKRERVLTTNIFRQLPGPQVTDVSFDPSPDPLAPSLGNWIRASGVIKITATVNPAQALDCKYVRFTVVDTSGILPPVVQIISTPIVPTNNQFLLQWQGQDAAGNPVTLHDGLYRVTAVAYSQDTNGQTSLPGNTYPRDVRIETGSPLPVEFSVYPGKVDSAVVNLLFSPSSAPDWDYFQIWRNGSPLPDEIRSFGYKDLAVEAGTTYQYKVRAVDTAGTALDWDALEAKSAMPTRTGAVGAPSQPTGLTVSFTGATVKLLWLPPSSLTGIVGYHVYRDTTNTLVAAASSMADVVSYSVYDSSIEWLTAYVYTVLSFTADGVESPVAGLASGQVPDASESGWATVTTPEKPIYDLRMTVYSTGNKDSTVTVTDASMGTPLPGAGYTATKTAPSASRQVPMGNYIVTATSGQSTKSISVALTGDPTQAVWIAMTL